MRCPRCGKWLNQLEMSTLNTGMHLYKCEHCQINYKSTFCSVTGANQSLSETSDIEVDFYGGSSKD